MLRKYYYKYINIPITARAALWFVVCTMLQRCISFITVPIFTRLMPTAEYGIYSTYLSVYSIMTVVCTLNMEKCAYINGIAKAKSEYEKDQLVVPLLSLSEIITVVLFFIYLIFRNTINSLVHLPTSLMCLVFVQVLFEPSVVLWLTKQRFEYKYIHMVVMTIGMVMANALLGILFVMISEANQGLARVCSIVLVQIIIGVICYVYFFRRAKSFFKINDWKHTLNIQLPLLPHSLSLSILSSSDRIMINAIAGATQAAIYSVAYSCGYVVTTLKNSIVSAMTPWIYEKIKEKDYELIRVITKPIMLLVATMTFAFIAFAPEIVFILAPTEYHEAIYVIPPVAASSFFTFVYNMFSNISFYYEETKRIMFASMIGAIMNIVLNVIFIPLFGYVAAGYTTLFCYIMFTIAHYIIMKKIASKHGISTHIFDMRYVFKMSVFVLLATISFSFVYSSIFIRYMVLLAIVFVMVWKRKVFVETIHLIKRKKY